MISVVINRFPNKPEFLKTNASAVRKTDISAKSEAVDPMIQKHANKVSDFTKLGHTAGHLNEMSAQNVKEVNDTTIRNLYEGKSSMAIFDQLEVSDGSFIEFYLNGKRQEHYFSDIFETEYFLAVSLFMNARVSINMGQSKFKYFSDISKKEVKSTSDFKREYANKIEPYWTLCESGSLGKHGIFKLKD